MSSVNVADRNLSSSATYPLQAEVPEETRRLDDMHEGLKSYLLGNLSFAPLEKSAPRAILELGCGSGAWAIQAANQFPEAEVHAVDMSPLPPRPLPQNLKFKLFNLIDPFPFEPETFDIVHARFVLMHLPNFQDVLSRATRLVKPGGWIVVEELEHTLHDDGGLGPAVKSIYEAYHRKLREKKVDPFVGPALEGLLEASGNFSEVNVKQINIPLSGKHLEGNDLGASMRIGVQRGWQHVANNPGGLDAVTPQAVKEVLDEMDDPNRDLYFKMYFTWSRKL